MSPKIFLALVIVFFVCCIPGMLSQKQSFKSIGCFKDKKQRALEKNFGKVSKISLCVDKCRDLKLKYAGLQYGGYCFCGNKHDKYGKANKCNKKCRSGEICGGGWANSVFEVLEIPKKKVEIPVKIEYLGCYSTQSLGVDVGSILTARHCIKRCRRIGRPYAGIHYGFGCSCGGRRQFNKLKKTDENRCIYNCSDKNKCGGAGVNSIYKVPKYPKDYIPEGYVGCYDDDLLKREGIERYFRSVSECTDLCREKKKKYAGLFYASSCYCGNKYNKERKNSDCTVRCESGEPCGNMDILSIYEVLDPVDGAIPVDCFQVSTPRILSSYQYSVKKVSECLGRCMNFKYLGLEEGKKCYCGNDNSKAVKSNNCNKKCGSGEICGGNGAVSVFKVVLDP